MSIEQACKLLKLNASRSIESLAASARFRLEHLTPESALRYAVACDVLIRAAR